LYSKKKPLKFAGAKAAHHMLVKLTKALHYKHFSVDLLTKQLQKLMIKTKRIILIIIVSFVNNKLFDYNKNKQKERVLIVIFAMAIKTCYIRLFS